MALSSLARTYLRPALMDTHKRATFTPTLAVLKRQTPGKNLQHNVYVPSFDHESLFTAVRDAVGLNSAPAHHVVTAPVRTVTFADRGVYIELADGSTNFRSWFELDRSTTVHIAKTVEDNALEWLRYAPIIEHWRMQNVVLESVIARYRQLLLQRPQFRDILERVIVRIPVPQSFTEMWFPGANEPVLLEPFKSQRIFREMPHARVVSGLPHVVSIEEGGEILCNHTDRPLSVQDVLMQGMLYREFVVTRSQVESSAAAPKAADG